MREQLRSIYFWATDSLIENGNDLLNCRSQIRLRSNYCIQSLSAGEWLVHDVKVSDINCLHKIHTLLLGDNIAVKATSFTKLMYVHVCVNW